MLFPLPNGKKWGINESNYMKIGISLREVYVLIHKKDGQFFITFFGYRLKDKKMEELVETKSSYWRWTGERFEFVKNSPPSQIDAGVEEITPKPSKVMMIPEVVKSALLLMMIFIGFLKMIHNPNHIDSYYWFFAWMGSIDVITGSAVFPVGEISWKRKIRDMIRRAAQAIKRLSTRGANPTDEEIQAGLRVMKCVEAAERSLRNSGKRIYLKERSKRSA